MKRWKTFTFRVSTDERRMIATLAKKLERSQSDAVRFVVINATRELNARDRASKILIPNNQDKSGLDEFPYRS